ncbi:MAG: type II secretion system major pseudopilin GspG [Pirellulales bacterium]
MNRSLTFRKRRGGAQPAGFTLIEVLLVLVILVILGAIAVPMFIGVGEGAKAKAALAQVQMFEHAIDTYQITVGQIPASLDDLVNPPADAKLQKRWNGPYLKENKSLVDPWLNPYNYSAKGKQNKNSYDVWSLGPDGQDNTADDIGNWPEK